MMQVLTNRELVQSILEFQTGVFYQVRPFIQSHNRLLETLHPLAHHAKALTTPAVPDMARLQLHSELRHAATYVSLRQSTLLLEAVGLFGQSFLSRIYRCRPCLVDSTVLALAIESGNRKVVAFFHDHVVKSTPDVFKIVGAMNIAAGHGQLDILRYLHEQRPDESGSTTSAMDAAAANGHFTVLKWLHVHRAEGCTFHAMDRAAQQGSLAIVQWLHENRTEGCSTAAIDGAARAGHVDVVQWLTRHRTEGCTSAALDGAAQSGHLAMVQWLHNNRAEGCTTHAMDRACESGHLNVVTFLGDHRREGWTPYAMASAVRNGHVDVVRYLHEVKGVPCPLVEVHMAKCNRAMAEYLLQRRTLQIYRGNSSRNCTPVRVT
ncbi:hypothetical protein DYB26_004197 [Aphanomyces astaci]|uniref:Uncharacterized protein n=1 Tax=Aphanomyces astaci TaxID=112090 RepID=A0A397FFM9_APHAT|nr:hypothetical protein DYB26_004197 [Aphanomyces astaci]RHZ20840.1 hypothetical protein DYB31_005193 [Aphanomyces astaci]